jgi:hypothetical protein
LGAQQKFLIRTDHQNLKYFKSPQNITSRQARWQQILQDYNFEITHLPSKSNTIANLLSRRKDFEGGVNPNKQVTLLPEHLFARKIYLENDLETRRKILQEIHDVPAGGHPRISNTWNLVNRKYEGPQLHQFVKNYVKGCAKCQESKVITHMKRAPLYHFDTHVEQCYASVLSLCHAFIFFVCLSRLPCHVYYWPALFRFYWTYFGLSRFLDT